MRSQTSEIGQFQHDIYVYKEVIRLSKVTGVKGDMNLLEVGVRH